MEKRELFKEILRIIVAVLTALLTALTATSCKGLSVKGQTEYEYNKVEQCTHELNTMIQEVEKD